MAGDDRPHTCVYTFLCACVCVWVFKKFLITIGLQIVLENEKPWNTVVKQIIVLKPFLSPVAAPPFSRLPLWNCPGKQCWGLCAAELPRDARVHEKVQRASHSGWSAASEVSGNLLAPKCPQWGRKYLAFGVCFCFCFIFPMYFHYP